MMQLLAPTVRIPACLAAAGLAFGWAYFAVLRRAVSLYCAGDGALRAGALTIGRLAAAVAFFAAAAHLGALPLLAALLGFVVARMLAMREARSEA